MGKGGLMYRYERYEKDPETGENVAVEIIERPFTDEEHNTEARGKREFQYEQQGWDCAWDLLDDLLNQLDAAGITLPAKTTRDNIKQQFPKRP
jgi:hypothetical protein